MRVERVRIERDEHGIPHGDADDQAGAFWAMGHMHATDRRMQMVLTRIIGQGRLCELLSDDDDSLEVDRLFKRLGFGVDAGEEWDKLDEEAQALMAAYVDGINDALADGKVPWELRLAGLKEIEPWTFEDTVVLSRLMGFAGLAQSQGALERFLLESIHAGVDARLLQSLFGDRIKGLDTDLFQGLVLAEPMLPEGIRLAGVAGTFSASNNWVIAGTKTASGHPMLANDPHLEVNRLPAVWQEVALSWPGGHVLGATVPGLPAVLMGRTEHLSWGVTYSYQDGHDSWIEECKDGKHRRGKRWMAFHERHEVIRRKKHEDQHLVVHESRHGILEGDPHVQGRYISSRWAASRGTGARSMAAFIDLLGAATAKDGMRALGRVETAWNWVFADKDGGIGYQMSGLAPRRKADWNGFVPAPGWDSAFDWKGFHKPTDLPRCLDPDEGFFVTANDTLSHYGKTPTQVQNATMGPYRRDRIATRLADRDDWTIEATAALQVDTRSEQAMRYLPMLRPLLPPGKHADLLQAWNGHYDADSWAAWLFERFYQTLLAEVLTTAVGAEAAQHLLEETGLTAGFYHLFDETLTDPESPWYGPEGRDATWRRILDGVCTGSIKRRGTQTRFHMEHLMLGRRLPGLARGPFRSPGSRGSIWQYQAFRVGGRKTTFGPTYRLVTDMGEPDLHTILAGGPTDRPFTKGYASEVKAWMGGRLKRIRPRMP